MSNQDFDRLLESIRAEDPGLEATVEAAARVRVRLASPAAPIQVDQLRSCADFRTLRAGYRDGSLSEARRMLLEDHLHSCVACRKFFRGEEGGAAIPISRRRPVIRWVLAAAALVAIALALPGTFERVLAPSGPRGTVASVEGELYRLSGSMIPIGAGALLMEHDAIRTGKGSRAVLRLRDGSMVELAERTEVSLSERWRAKTVRLERGAVVVEAAKQHSGRLEVSTPDCLVSVKGTVFGVSRGTKGSRVSVVEGEVKVDQNGASRLLHKGDQSASSATMASTSVAVDLEWSRNAAKYLALMGELSGIQKRIEEIPSPGLRYQSKLAAWLPANTVVFASIPNLGPTLAEAGNIFEERLQQSAVLREWWSEADSQQLRTIVDKLRTIGDYLGDEVVVAVPASNRRLQDPLVLAEVRRPGLPEVLAREFGKDMSATVQDNIVVVSPHTVTLSEGAFLATPFWQRISESYQSGAGMLFAANMEQIVPIHVTNSQSMTGIDNVRYLTIERKPNLGRTENQAALTFNGERSGIAGWLAAPGPMGTLEFVSPQATVAAAFVVKTPAAMLRELEALAGPLPDRTVIHMAEDAADALGGEMTIALDGPLLPMPAWKVALEVNDPVRLQRSIEQSVQVEGAKLSSEEVGGLTYYAIRHERSPIVLNYVYVDGYLLMAPDRALLVTAIQNRAAGVTLPRSNAFRAQLPQDGHVNFSGLIYNNLGATLGPIADQLKSSGITTPEQQRAISMFTSSREPALIYAYAEPDRIIAASRGSSFGLGLDTLVMLSGKRADPALPQLLGPMLKARRSQ